MVNIYQVLTPQQSKIMYLKRQGKSVAEIAEMLNISRKQIQVVTKRAKEKIGKLEAQSIEVVWQEMDEDIEDLFNEEQERSLPKLTVKQASFLSNKGNMHLKTNAARAMRSRLGLSSKKEKVFVRQMTPEEREAFIDARKKDAYINKEFEILNTPGATKALMEYEFARNRGAPSPKLADMEVFLRAHGLMYRTENLNKRNSKTGLCLRASADGKKVVLVKDSEKHLLPPNAIYVESDREEQESVWIVEESWKAL